MAKKQKPEIDRTKLKTQITELKVERDRALEAKDSKQLKKARRQIHRLKHQLRAHVVVPAPAATQPAE